MTHLLLVLAMLGCATAHSATAPPAVDDPAPTDAGAVHVAVASLPYLKVEPVQITDQHDVVRAPARVDFRDGAMAQVGVPIAGKVVGVRVKVGDKVHAGDALVTLDSPEAAAARADFQRAELALEQARDTADRQARMLAQGVGVESDKFAAGIALQQATADDDRARRAVAVLGDGSGATVVLRAPIDGTVLERSTLVGAAVEPGGEPLVKLGNSNALWVVADVFERDLSSIDAGADATVELSASAAPVHGHVVSVGARLDDGMRTAPVYIGLDDEPAGLRAGMFARAQITGAASQGVALPATAVLVKEGGQHVVYVQEAPLAFKARDVTIGQPIDGKIQVTGGLTNADHVVVEGALLLDGAADQML